MKDTHSNNSYVELQIQICNLYLENKGFGTAMGWSPALQAGCSDGFDSHKLHTNKGKNLCCSKNRNGLLLKNILAKFKPLFINGM